LASIGVCKWNEAQQSQPKDRGYSNAYKRKDPFGWCCYSPCSFVYNMSARIFCCCCFQWPGLGYPVSNLDNVLYRDMTQEYFCLHCREVRGLKWLYQNSQRIVEQKVDSSSQVDQLHVFDTEIGIDSSPKNEKCYTHPSVVPKSYDVLTSWWRFSTVKINEDWAFQLPTSLKKYENVS